MIKSATVFAIAAFAASSALAGDYKAGGQGCNYGASYSTAGAQSVPTVEPAYTLAQPASETTTEYVAAEETAPMIETTDPRLVQVIYADEPLVAN